MASVTLLCLWLQVGFVSQFKELEIGNKIPASFAVAYMDAGDGIYDQYFKYYAVYKPNFGNSFFTLVLREENGVCNVQHIATFTPTGKLISMLKIESSCDQDGAYPKRTSWEYRLDDASGSIQLFYTIESVVDTSLIDDDGLLLEGYDFGDLETKVSGKKERYLILENGEIVLEE